MRRALFARSMHIHEQVHVYTKLAAAGARSILSVAAVAGMRRCAGRRTFTDEQPEI
jgi:hypothetical protein